MFMPWLIFFLVVGVLGVCDPGYEEWIDGDDYCYMLVFDKDEIYQNASNACNAAGNGQLIVPTDSAQNRGISNRFESIVASAGLNPTGMYLGIIKTTGTKPMI